MQLAAPREALLVRRAPGTLQRRDSCTQLRARPPGRALCGRGHPAGGARVWSEKNAAELRSALSGTEQPPRQAGECKPERRSFQSTLRRTSSSPCQSADHRLGSPKGSGAPLPSGPGSLQYSFCTDPRAGARPLVLRLESGPLPSSLRPSSRPKVTSPPPSGFSRPSKPCCCWLDKVQLQKASQL